MSTYEKQGTGYDPGAAGFELQGRGTLGDALPKEMARIRDVMLPAYQEICPAGAFALHFMRIDLDRAAVAMAEGDLPGMIAAYKALRGYKL